jgi:fatty-acyl-CoA synthase
MSPANKAWIRALESVAAMQRDKTLTLPAMLDGLAATHGDRPALIGVDERLSYAELARRADQVASWAASRHSGAVLGLLMPNRPDYVAIWLGLTRAGCVVALLNPNLTGDALRHAVRSASCAAVIVDPVLREPASSCGTALLDPADLAASPVAPPTVAPSDQALLVFTSGTTGLPKASVVTHARVLEWALWFAGMMDLEPGDRIFDCLPLYHSTGGIVAIGAALVRGASVRIAPGFSASRFWDDLVGADCTVFFYIGELCRYLTNAPPHPRERAHRLRLAVGNGLQGSVWEAFQSRFGVTTILEFYAATEGGVSLYNCEGKPGAIGRVPPFLQARFPLALIRVDAETGDPLRGSDGLCQACAVDEPGEALGRLGDGRRFDGYTDPEASSRKVLSDVLAPGDRWFRSGDLMRRDAAGFYYFVDRMGDTFRWKGENVSTSEVAAVVRSCPGVADAVVYGVRIPGHEGRAGMAAIVPGDGCDVHHLASHVAARLPVYARPVFLRICTSLDLTGTFKHAASRLAREGYADCADPVWFNRRESAIRCDADLVAAIADGRERC